jgi:hypothetical protein
MESVKALFEKGILSHDQRVMLDGFCRRWNCSGFEALLETNIVQESQFADHASEILGLPRIRNLRGRSFNLSPAQHLPLPFARRNIAIVFESDVVGHGVSSQHKVFKVAVANPWDGFLENGLRDLLHGEVQLFIGDRSDILDAIDRNYPFSDFVPEFWRSMSSITAD